MVFSSLIYSSNEVKIKSLSAAKTSQMLNNVEWRTENTKIRPIYRWDNMAGSNETFIVCSIHLVRKPLFYTFYIIMPTIGHLVITYKLIVYLE